MRSVLSSDGNSRTWRAGLPARAVGKVADHRTAPERASSARRPMSVWTTIMSGPACKTSSAVASEAARTRPCIRPPSPFFFGSVCSNSPSFTQRCSPVTCCQRTSSVSLSVHAAVGPVGPAGGRAGAAAVCARAAVWTTMTSAGTTSVRRANRTAMAIPLWTAVEGRAHISPHHSPERKGGRHSGLSAPAPKPQERLGWGTTTSLPAAVHSPGAVIFSGTVYVAGGSGSGNAPVATVYRAVIQSDGMLRNLPALPSLPFARSYFGFGINGTSLYALGCDSGSVTPNDSSLSAKAIGDVVYAAIDVHTGHL